MKYSVLLIFYGICVGSSLLAATTSYALSANEIEVIERRARAVIATLDPAAIVVVRENKSTLPAGKSELMTLPGGPFEVDSLIIGGGPADAKSSTDAIARIEVRVWTKAYPIPREIVSILRDMAPPDSELSVQSFPAIIAASADAPGDVRHDWSRDDVTSIKDSLVGISRGVEALPTAFDKTDGVDRLVEFSREWVWVPLGFIFLLVGGRVASIVAARGGANKIAGALGETLLKATSGGDPRRAESSASSGPKSAPAISGGRDADRFVSEELDSLGEKGASALFADLYWGGRDSEAVWLWLRMSPGLKKTLLRTLPQMTGWAIYLPSVTPENTAAHLDPHYHEPLAIAHVDNAAIGEKITHGDSALFHSLSAARKRAIRLPAARRFELMREDKERGRGGSSRDDERENDLDAMPASQLRTFEQAEEIVPLSNEEEIEIASAAANIEWALARTVLTTAHASRLSSAEIAEALSGLNARDIARGLVGPDDVRSAILSAIPLSKRELVESYAGEVAPRGSPEHRVLVDRLRSAVTNREESPEGKG